MALGSESGCINHPGVEAVIRCKQCGRPACSVCRVKGPTGDFCSDACKDKHQAFVARAQQLESGRKVRRPFPLWRIVRKALAWSLLLVLVVLIAAIFGVEIPYLTPLLRQILPFFE
jgi:hypothetical protein